MEELHHSSEETQFIREQEQHKFLEMQSNYEEASKVLEKTKTELLNSTNVIHKLKMELTEKNDKLSAADETIVDLRKQNEDDQLCVQQLKEEINDFLLVFNNSDLTLKGAKALVVSLQNENENDKLELSNVQVKLSDLKEDMILMEASCNDRVLDSNKQKNLVEEELEKLKHSEDLLKEELLNRQRDVEKSNSDLEDLKRKLEDTVLELNQQKREVSILKDGQSVKGDEFESRIQSLLTQLTDAENRVLESNNTIQDQCKQIDKLTCDLQRSSQDSDAYKNEILVLQNVCEEKDKYLTNTTHCNNRLEETIKELQMECHNLQTDICEKDNKICDLSSCAEQLDNNLKELNEKLLDLNYQKDIIESENTDLKQEITQRHSAIAELHFKLSMESQRRLSEEKEISDLKISNIETVQHLKSLELETENLKCELQTTQSELNHIKTLCSEKDVRVQNLTQTVQTVTDENERLQVFSTEISEKLVSSQSALQEMSERLKTSEEALAALQAENENLQKQVSGMKHECILKHEQLCSLQATLSQVQNENEKLHLELHSLEKLALDCSDGVSSLLKHVCSLNSGIKEKLACIFPPKHSEDISEYECIASSCVIEHDLRTLSVDINNSATNDFEPEHELYTYRTCLNSMSVKLNDSEIEWKTLNLNTVKLLDIVSDMSLRAKDLESVLASLQSENCDLRDRVQIIQCNLNEKLSEIQCLKSSHLESEKTIKRSSEKIQGVDGGKSVFKYDFETELSKVKEELALETAGRKAAEESNKKLSDAQQKYIAENGSILLENQVLKCQICDLNENLKIFEEKCYLLEAEVQAVKQNWIKIQSNLSSMEMSFETVAKEKEALQIKFDFTTEKVDLMREERDKYKLEVQRLLQEIKKLSSHSCDSLTALSMSHFETEKQSVGDDETSNHVSNNIQEGKVDMQETLKTLTDEKSTLSETANSLHCDLVSLQTELQEHMSTCKHLQVQKDAFQLEVNCLLDEVKSSKELNDELQKVNSSLSLEKERITEEQKKINDENELHKNLILTIKKEVFELQMKKQELDDKNLSLKQKIGSLESEMEKVLTSKKCLEEELVQKDSELKHAYASYHSAENDKYSLALKLSVIEKELQDTFDQCESSRSLVNDLKLCVKKCKEQLAELGTSKQELEDVNMKLEDAIQILSQERKELELQFEKLENNKRQLENEFQTTYTESSRKIEELESKLLFECKDKANLCSLLEQQKLEISHCNKNIKEYEDAHIALQNRLQSTECALQTLEGENSSKQLQIDELREKNQSYEEKLGEMHKSLAFSESVIDRKAEEVIKLESELRKSQNVLSSKYDESKALNVEHIILKEELETAKNRNEILAQEIFDLNLKIYSTNALMHKNATILQTECQEYKRTCEQLQVKKDAVQAELDCLQIKVIRSMEVNDELQKLNSSLSLEKESLAEEQKILNDEKDFHQRLNLTIKKEVIELQTKHQELYDNNLSLTTKIKSLESEIETILTSKNCLEEELVQKDSELKRTHAFNQSIENDKCSLALKLSVLEKELQSAHDQCDSSKSVVNALKHTLKEGLQKLANSESSKQELEDANMKLESKIQTLSQERKEQELCFEKLQNNHNKLENEFQTINTESSRIIEELENKIHLESKDKANLNSLLEQQILEISVRDKNIKEYKDTIVSLKSKLQSTESLLQTSECENNSKLLQIGELREKNHSLEEMLGEMQKSLVFSESEMENITASKKCLEAELFQKDSELKHVHASYQTIENDKYSLALKLSIVETEFQNALDQCDSFKSLINSLQHSLIDGKKQLAESEMSKHELQDAYMKLEDTNQTLSEERKELQLHFEKLLINHTQLENEIQTVNTENARKIEELESKILSECKHKENLNNQLEQQKLEMSNCEKNIKEYEYAAVSLQNKLQSVESGFQSLKFENSSKLLQIDELTEKHQNFEAVIGELRTSLTFSESVIDSKATEITQLESKLTMSENLLLSKNDEWEALNDKCINIKKKLESVKIQNEVFAQEVSDLNLNTCSTKACLHEKLKTLKFLNAENARLSVDNEQKGKDLIDRETLTANLQTQLGVCENKVEETLAILKNSELIIKEKNDILINLSEVLQLYKFDGNELISEVNSLLCQSAEKDEKIVESETKLQKSLEEYQSLQQISGEFQDLNAKYQNEIEDKKVQNRLLEEANIKLSEEVDDLNGEVAEFKNRLFTAENVITDLESKVLSLSSDIHDLTMKNELLSDQCINAKTKCQCILNDLCENQLLLSRLQSTLEEKELLCTELSSKMSEVGERLSSRDTENKQLEALIEQLQSDCLEHKSSLDDRNKDSIVKEGLLKTVSLELEENQKYSETLLDSVENKKEQIIQLNKKCSELQEALDIKYSQNADLNSKIVIAEARYTETLGHYDVMEQRYETLESELSQLRDKLFLLLMKVYDGNKSTEDPSSPSSPFEHLSAAEKVLAENDDSLVDELAKEIEALLLDNRSLKTSCKAKADDIGNLHMKMRDSVSQCDMLETKLVDLQSLLNEKETVVANLANNVQELETNLQKVKEERNLKVELLSDNITDLVTQLDNCTHQRDELESELNDAISNLENTEAARCELENKQSSSEICLEEKSAALEVLQDQFSCLSDENSKLVKSLNESESIMLNKNLQIEELTLEKQGLILERSQLEKAEKELTVSLQTLQESVEEAEAKLTSKQNDLELKNEENIKIQTELKVSLKKVEELSSEISYLESSVEKYKEDVVSLETVISDLNENLSQLRNINKDLYLQLNNKDTQFQILSDEHQSLWEENAAMITTCRRHCLESEMLKRNMERFEERLDEAATKETELKSFVDTYSIQTEELNSSKLQLSESLQTAQRDIMILKQTFENEKEAHQETKKAMEKIIEEHQQTDFEAQIILLQSSCTLLHEKVVNRESECNNLVIRLIKTKELKNSLLLENRSLYSQIESLEKQLLEQLQWISEFKKESEKKNKIIEEHEILKCRASQLESAVFELEEDQKVRLKLIESLKKETTLLKTQLQDAEVKSLALVVGLETEKDALVAQLEDLKMHHSSEVTLLQNTVNSREEAGSSSQLMENSLHAGLSPSVLSIKQLQDDNEMLKTQLKETCENLKSQIDSLKSTNDLLISDVSDLTEQTHHLKTEKTTLEFIKTELEDKLEIIRNDYDKALSDLSNYMNEVEKMSCQIKECDIRNKELYETSVMLSQKIEEKDRNLDEVVQALNAANLKLRDYQNAVQKKDQEIYILENSIYNIREECLSDKSVLSRLMIGMKEANQKFSVLVDTIVEKDTAMSVMEKDLEEMNLSLEEAESKIAQLTEDNKEQRKLNTLEISDIISEKEKVAICLDEKNIQFTEICSKLQTSEEKILSIEQKLQLCQEEKYSVEEEFLLLKSETHSLTEEINHLKAEMTALEKDNADKNQECLILGASLKESNTQLKYLMQSSECMTETLEKKESEVKSLHKEIETMSANITKYENLSLEKNTQLGVLVEELETDRRRLFTQMSVSAKLILQKQILEKMLSDVQNKMENNNMKDQKGEFHVLQRPQDENKKVAASIEPSRQALTDKTALVTRIKHDSEIKFQDVKKKIETFRKDVRNLKNDYLNYTETIALHISSAISEFVHSNTDTYSLQAEQKDQSDAVSDDMSSIVSLERERDEVQEQLNVRNASYDTLIDKYKLIEDENQNLKADFNDCVLELTKARADLNQKSELIQTLEYTVQDTEYNLNQVLADKESIQMKNSILEDQNVQLTQEIERLHQIEMSFSNLEQSYKEANEYQNIQYQLLCAELEVAKENVISLRSLNPYEKAKMDTEVTQGQTKMLLVGPEEGISQFEKDNDKTSNESLGIKDIDRLQEMIHSSTSKVEELNNIVLMKNQQILSLEQELTNMKETQVAAIEWDDYDLRNICNKLENEKRELTTEVSNQNKLLKKKDGQIKALSRQLDNLHKENEFDNYRKEHVEMQEATEGSGCEVDSVSCHAETSATDTLDIIENAIIPSLNATLNSECLLEVGPQALTDSVLDNLKEKLNTVTVERDKFKADNKKLLKVGKAKDTKLNIMNKNFEKLRQKRDELLEEKDSLDNELQALISKTSNFDSSYDKEVINNLMMRCKELEALCEEKQIEQLNPDTQHMTQTGDSFQTDTETLNKVAFSKSMIVDKEQDASELETQIKPAAALKTEVLKLQKINKGKEAKIRKFEERLSVQENEIKILKEILAQKEADLSSASDERNAIEKIKEEKIILDFELQCAREELAKLKHSQSFDQAEGFESFSTTQNASEMLQASENEDTLDIFDLPESSSDIIRSKVVSVLQENKKLKQENSKLHRVSKGKEAKVKKVEDFVSQQQKVISDKETDIVILKESVKDLTSKIESLTEEERDLRYRLENALLDRDEWYDHCQDLEDQLDAAHESIDIKNDELLRLDETADADKETIDNLIYERDSLEREVEDLKNELESLQNRLSRKDEEVRDYKAQLVGLLEEKEKHSLEIKKLQMVKKGKAAKAKKLEESVLVQENAMEAKEEFISSLESKIQEMLSHMNAIENENAEMKSQIQELESNKQQLNSKERETENKLEILNSKLINQDEEIKALIEAKEKLDTEIEIQNAKMVKETQFREAKEFELKEQLMQKCELEKRLQDFEENIQQINSVVAEREETITDLENKLSARSNALQEKESFLLSLQETTNNYLAQMQEKDSEVITFQNRIIDLEKYIEILKTSGQEQLQVLSSTNEELKQAIISKVEELESMTGRCEALKKQFDYNMSLIQEKDNEISSLRKKYIALDQESVLKQSLIEEKEKHMSTLSDQEILKLQKIAEDKEASINTLKKDIQVLFSERESYSKKVEEKTREFDLTKQHMLEEKNALEQNLSWYVQYHETSNASILALQEEKLSNEMKLQDMKTQLTEHYKKSQEEEAAHKRFAREKEELVNELQIQYSQVLEKLEVYKNDLKEKQIMEDNLLKETEDLKCHYQQLSHQKELELSEKDTLISVLQTDLKESLNSKMDIKYIETGKHPVGNLAAKEDMMQSQVFGEEMYQVLDVHQQEDPTKVKEFNGDSELRTEIIKLKKICKGKDAKIKKLEEKLKTVSPSDGASADNGSKQLKAETLKSNLKQVEDLLVESQQEKEKLLAEVECLSKHISEKQTDIEKLLSDQREAAILKESLNNQISSLHAHSDTVEKNLETYRIARDESQSDLLRLQTECANIQHQAHLAMADLKSKLNVANAEVTHLNQLIETYNLNMQSALSEKEELISSLSLKDDELKKLKGILQDNIKEIQYLNDKLVLAEQNSKGFQSEKESFEDLLKSEKEEIRSLYEQMNELVSEKLDLETSVQEKEQDLRAAKETLQILASDREKLQTILSEKEELQLEVETLSRDLNTLRERLGQRDAEKDLFLNNLQEKENDVMRVTQQLDLLESEKKALSGKLKSMNENLILLEEKTAVISKELETKKEAASKLKDMCFEKDQLITSLKETVDTASSEIKSLTLQKEQLEHLNEELSLYKQQYHEEKQKSLATGSELVNLIEKCNQLEISVTEKDNTLISKAEEIGILHRRIASLEESLCSVNQNCIVPSERMIEEDVKVLEMETTTEAARVRQQESEVPSMVSIESQIIRTEVLSKGVALSVPSERRHTDQVYHIAWYIACTYI